MRAGRQNRDGTWNNESGAVLAFEDPVSHDDVTVRVDGHHVFLYSIGDDKPPKAVWMRRSDSAVIAQWFAEQAMRSMTDDERLVFSKQVMRGYCELCGKDLEGRKCYCAPNYDE